MWAPLTTAGLGAWLLASPFLFSYATGGAATVSYILGPIILVSSILAFWEILASARWISVFAAVTLISTPLWLPLGEHSDSARVINIITGLITLGISLLPRTRCNRYGGGWSILRRVSDEPDVLKWS